jgi:dipeptidase D
MDKYNRLLEIFDEIVKIPRDSSKEDKIAKYVCDFAENLGLEYRIDDYYNVIVKRKADSGMENKKSLMFQAHLDMVCEKIIDSNHNFDTDPIEVIKKEDIYTAKDTTLGADDGIGVSIALLLMEDKDIKLPLTYFLFTTNEETGMDGAKNVDLSDVNVDYMINLDSEEEDSIIIGCAGGETITFEKEFNTNTLSNNIFILNINGLKGGHSGVDIDKGRISSNYLGAYILSKLDDVKLITFVGGTKTNAIPNNSEIVFSTDNVDKSIIDSIMEELEITEEDKNVNITIEEINGTFDSLSIEDSNDIISLIMNLKQNVIYKSTSVDTSGNIGIIKLDKGKIVLLESLRSNINSKLKEVREDNIKLATSLGFNNTIDEGYPGWDYDYDSELLKKYVSSYKETHDGNEPIISSIHAGLECGLLKNKISEDTQIISVGPTLEDVHTVDETLYLDSCKKLINTLYNFIEKY